MTSVTTEPEPQTEPAARPSAWGRLRALGKPVATIILSGAVLFLGGVAFAVLASLKEEPVRKPEEQITYNLEAFEVQPVTVRERISGFGTALADREVIVSAEVSGVVEFVADELRVGRKVTPPPQSEAESEAAPGETVAQIESPPPAALVTIDPRTYRERLAQARTRLDELETEQETLAEDEANIGRLVKDAQTDVDVYREEYERAVNSLRSRAISPSQFTQTRLQYQTYRKALSDRQQEQKLLPLRKKSLEKRTASAKAELELAELDVERTTIPAPFSGVVAEVMVEQGEFVRVGDPLFRLTELNVIEVPVPITLKEAARLRERIVAGETPAVGLSESETEPSRWFGTLDRIAPEADAATRTILIYVTVDNSGQSVPLVPGAFVHALIEGELHEKAVVVPRDAIRKGTVYAVRQGKVVPVRVTVDRTFQSLAILDPGSGLQAGDELMLTNIDRATDAKATFEVRETLTVKDALAGQRIELLLREESE